MLMDVATAVTAEATNILNVRSETLEEGGEAVLSYDVMVQDRPQLDALIAAVSRVPDVTRVRRAHVGGAVRSSSSAGAPGRPSATVRGPARGRPAPPDGFEWALLEEEDTEV